MESAIHAQVILHDLCETVQRRLHAIEQNPDESMGVFQEYRFMLALIAGSKTRLDEVLDELEGKRCPVAV